MNSLEMISLALKNIRSSKMRSFLTMLGIIIGVAAVFVIAGLGNGMKDYMKSSFSDMGTNTLDVMVYGNENMMKKLTPEDMYEFVSENGTKFEAMSPIAGVSGSLVIDGKKVETSSQNGVGEDYLKVKNQKIAEGRNFQYMDVKNYQQVCVVGAYISQRWFAGQAVGQELYIEGNPFIIVGVLEQTSDEVPSARSNDDTVLIPYTTAMNISKTADVSQYTLTTDPSQNPQECRQLMEQKLTEIFGGGDYFYVQSMAEMLKEMDGMIGMAAAVLSLIAAISLVVGGIGIMNIMLVSVTERTREIGIRKALGAREKYIKLQFITEAAITSGLGGIFGMIAGRLMCAGASVAIQMAANKTIMIKPSLAAVLLSFGISVMIGIVFGFLPARKAAGLNPVDALSHS